MEYQEAKNRFISAWGSLGSSWGINRTMAQIHALLLISPQALSAEEIMSELKVSRGNANMNIRSLIEWGLVEKEFVPGERKEFFIAGKDIWDLAKHIAKERKKRELEPIQRVLLQLKDVNGTGENAKEFRSVTSEINDFANQAESMLDMFVNSKQNWFYKVLGLFKK